MRLLFSAYRQLNNEENEITPLLNSHVRRKDYTTDIRTEMPCRPRCRSASVASSSDHCSSSVHPHATSNTMVMASDSLVAANLQEYQDIFASLSESERKMGERLCRHLQFFFMDPLMKWRVRKQVPFKLSIQILKIIFVTIQLVLFAELRIAHIDFMEATSTVMRHKFLKNWDDERDALVYPPSAGRYSVYTGAQIVEEFAFTVNSYYSVQEDLFASFSYDTTSINRRTRGTDKVLKGENATATMKVPFNKIPPINFCIERIANATVVNNTYEFDVSRVNECFLLNFTQREVDAIKKDPYALTDPLKRRGITFEPDTALIISKADLNFNLRTIHFSPVSTDQRPECYLINVKISFDNTKHTGQVYVQLSTVISYVDICNGRIIQGAGLPVDTVVMCIIDLLVLLMCSVSFILCFRALIRAHLLEKATKNYFETVLKKKLTASDSLEFLNLWYVMIVLNDTCIIIGTVCKISIEFRDFDSDVFTTTGILLGTGALLVYVGVLRYFGFFSKYNILILTMKKSLPNILRFLSCATVLYTGFLIAGWVIIGPYSLKFRTLGKSSEALFSLLNGDDMFATFFTINDSNAFVKMFGTIYIYVFVSLFIYVVLSLFIAIIMDAYEVVKDRYSHGVEVERSLVLEFMNSFPACINIETSDKIDFSRDHLINLDCCNVLSEFFAWLRGRPNRILLDDTFENQNFTSVNHSSGLSDGNFGETQQEHDQSVVV
ncbi:hypothetical protein AB6A40_003180 [Gnathostoma spinigerum]|uniref:Polycystin cation channel PKD1/PKD2 domain-containing protein n=1 Tax=Gnathostoma spinigerum TaxID=75299 RepID=A0ABD6EB97_9BILA